jgi:PadR family transcriptional regulator, regulatory protein AphA
MSLASYSANGTVATVCSAPMSASLTDSAYAVLVVIALRGPSTAYDLKRALARLAGEYWAVPHTQVYRECARLAASGMLDEQVEPSGRRRRVYELTAAGHDAVTAWIREPTDSSMEIRDVASLKLSAAELSTPDDVRALAERQVTAYRRRLAILDDLEARYGERPELALRIRNIAMGRAVYNAALTFWQGVAQDPMPKRRS